MSVVVAIGIVVALFAVFSMTRGGVVQIVKKGPPRRTHKKFPIPLNWRQCEQCEGKGAVDLRTREPVDWRTHGNQTECNHCQGRGLVPESWPKMIPDRRDV